MDRVELSKKYATGKGLEIGALCFPWPMPEGIKTDNLDFCDEVELKKRYPEHSNLHFKKVDIIGNAETCEGIEDCSYDFVVSSHNLEHFEDPIGAIYRWLQIVKTGGHLIMAVPHKDHCFDRDREATSVTHVIEDFLSHDLLTSRREENYREYLSKVDKLEGEALEKSVKWCMDCNYNIHFHCWNQATLWGLNIVLTSLEDLTCKEFRHVGHEFFWVLKKLEHPSLIHWGTELRRYVPHA